MSDVGEICCGDRGPRDGRKQGWVDYSHPCDYYADQLYSGFELLIGLIVTFSVIYGLFQIKKFLFDPLNRVRLLGEVGYVQTTTNGGGKKDRAAETARHVGGRRKRGNVPPVYPNGWFAVAESRDLAKGEAKSVHVLGMNLAIFRGEDGRSHAVDAYCPHMGADMGTGGTVEGNCLKCPFHGWLFDGDSGKCTRIPYSDAKIPPAAKVLSYETLEKTGFIFLWHHAEGLDPQWTPPDVTEIEDGSYKYGGRTEHFVNAHIEEIPENGADLAHLSQVHGPVIAAGTNLQRTYDRFWKFAHHEWQGGWEQDPDDKHVGLFNLEHGLFAWGWRVSLLDLKVEVKQIGPGLVYMIFDSPTFGKGAYIQTLTPVGPLLQRLVHHVYINKRCPLVVAKFLLVCEAIMAERDLMIWNNKQYLSKPVLVKSKEDQLIAKHRRWYSQFYSQRSRRIGDEQTAELESAERLPLVDTAGLSDW